MKYDVVIAGAGPGGTTCALALKNSGLKVALVDKAIFPRDKICGDALSGKVVSVLKYVDPVLEQALHRFPEKVGSWGIRFVAPNQRHLDIPFKNGKLPEADKSPGYISKRLDFDNFLLSLVDQSVDIHQGVNITNIRREKDSLSLQTDNGEITAKMVIGADGAHSIVNKSLGEIKVNKNHYSAGLRAYYQGVTDFHQDNFIELHYIKDLLPGYFWIFPLPDGYANVGLGMLSRDVSKHKVNLKQKLREIIGQHPTIAPRFRHATLVDDIRGFGLPLGSVKRPVSGERFMLVGDAASLIDPFSGEGIGNAMLSGKIAAAQIRECFEKDDFSANIMQKYDAAVYKKMWQELKLSHNLQKLVNFPWLFNFVVNKANSNEAVRTMFTMMFDDLDIRKMLSQPSFYWKLISGR